MRKNQHDIILREESKEQHLSTVPKSCPYLKLKDDYHSILPNFYYLIWFK